MVVLTEGALEALVLPLAAMLLIAALVAESCATFCVLLAALAPVVLPTVPAAKLVCDVPLAVPPVVLI